MISFNTEDFEQLQAADLTLEVKNMAKFSFLLLNCLNDLLRSEGRSPDSATFDDVMKIILSFDDAARGKR